MGTPTTNYGWIKPTVGADSDTWGTELNGSLDGIDSTMKTVSDSVPAFSVVQQGGGTGQGTNKVYIGWSAAGLLKAQVDSTDMGTLPTMNAPGGFLHNVNGSGGAVTYATTGPSGSANEGDEWVQYS